MSTFNLISVKYGMNASFDPWIEDGRAEAWFTNMAGSEQYFGWLSEYNSGKPVNGSYGGQFTIGASALQRSIITDGQIAATLAAAIGYNQLPIPNETTQYILHIPKGVMVEDPTGALSCKAFCGYHSHFNYSDMEIKYSVLPYSSDCSGCALSFEDYGSTVSHEIADTITNPLGSSWMDKCGEEIGDICAHTNGLAYGTDGKEYPVQLLWSNSRGDCYAGQSSSPDPNEVPTGMLTAKPSAGLTMQAKKRPLEGSSEAPVKKTYLRSKL